ncbi:MAG: hypothetical protein JWP63_4378 [Candidatus Solibacter sp.]|nr:hypothetical protein [Candidatus Solibacter sp.]
MGTCLKLVAALALTLPAFGQLLVEAVEETAIRQAFESAPSTSTLRCEIAPLSAALNFGFQFQAVYTIQIPLTQYSGAGHTIDTYTRVTPEGRPPVYFAKHERLPAQRGLETDAETMGAFIVGEGTYRADVLVEDDSGRVCRNAWQIQARRNGSERQLRLATPPGTVEELTLNITPVGEVRAGPRIARLTILVNAAPLAPKATTLTPEDIQKSVDTVTSILREMPAQTVRLIAFNLDQRAIIYRDDAYQAGRTGELADALGQLDFSVLDYKAIRDRMEPVDLLLSMVQAELGAPQPPDAMIVVGPRTLLITPLPAEAMSKRPNSTTAIFSLQFDRDRPPMRMPRTDVGMDASHAGGPRTAEGAVIQHVMAGPLDVIERLVARLKGQTVAIRTPHDLADAIQRMDSRIAKTAPAAPPPSPQAPPVPAPKSAPKQVKPAEPAGTMEITGDEDPVEVLTRVRDRVTAHGERIPIHTCVETIQRDTYESTAGHANASCDALLGFRKQRDFFQRLTLDSTDWLRLDVAYSLGKEIYSWAGARTFEEGDLDELVPEGAIGTGAFTSMVLSAFESHRPKYIFEGETKVDGMRLFEYSFTVVKENSRYRVKAQKEWVITGYTGTFLVDPKTAELVRLTVRTEELPPETNTCETDTTLEYGEVQLSGNPYLLPKAARQRFIGRDGFEVENTMGFAACRDFQAESKIEFDAVSAAEARQTSALSPLEFPADLPVTVELTTTVRFGTAAAGDRIEGRLAQPIVDANKKILAPAGTRVQGRLMRVEMQHVPRQERIIALRWETLRIGTASAPLSLVPNLRTGERQPTVRDGLRRRGTVIVLPLPSEMKYAVIRLPGSSMALESGSQSEWLTGKP